MDERQFMLVDAARTNFIYAVINSDNRRYIEETKRAYREAVDRAYGIDEVNEVNEVNESRSRRLYSVSDKVV